MTAAQKPDIVCIGAQKAGTSWVHEVLSTRHDIWAPPFKELHFFDHKFVAECRQWAPWHVRNGLKTARARHLERAHTPDASYLKYLDRLLKGPILNAIWYEYVFSRAADHQRGVDVTPEYSCLPESGITYFNRFLPDAKLIYIIRHPAERLRSQIRMMIQRRRTTPTTDSDWAELLEMSALRTRGDYLNNVPRWDAQVPEERLLYLPFGAIKSDPRAVLRRIEEHCGLPAARYPSPDRKVHQTDPVTLPEAVEDWIDAQARPQNRFLEERFGAKFFQATR